MMTRETRRHEKGYKPLEEDDFDEDPTNQPPEGLPDSSDEGKFMDADTERRLKETAAAERERLERAEGQGKN